MCVMGSLRGMLLRKNKNVRIADGTDNGVVPGAGGDTGGGRLLTGTARQHDELMAPDALRREHLETGGLQLARDRRSGHAVVLLLRPSFRIRALVAVRREINHRQASTGLQ